MEESEEAACLSDLEYEMELAVNFVGIEPSYFIFKYEKHFRISGGD